MGGGGGGGEMTNGLGYRSKSTTLVKNLETRTRFPFHDVDLGITVVSVLPNTRG